MTDRHTPGPLRPLEVIGGAGTGFHQYIVDAAGRKIGCCWGKAEEKVANAVLWSQASELLGHARLFEKTIEYYIKKARSEDDEEGARLMTFTLYLVRETIAKATEVAT